MKIGIFGGSFDPIHLGHIKLAKLAFEELKLDKIILVPVYKNPFKKDNKIENGKHRLKMIELVLNKNWQVCKFELKRKKITYAFEVVDHLYKKENQLYYLIGSDNIKKLNKWKNIDKLSNKAQLICFKRTSKIIKNINVKKYGVKFLENKIYHQSSTEYKVGAINMVDERVQEYIADNLLYLDTIAYNTLPLKRYTHCKNTALLAKEYAIINNLNSKNAYFAGLMHDFTKYWDVDDHNKIMDEHNLKYQDVPKEILHQYSGALWIKYKFLIVNDDIYNAIAKHTTADVSMSKFDKMIYLADKLSRGRKFPGITALRNLALKDIDQAFIKMLEISRNHILQKNGNMDEKSLLIYKRWLE